LAQTLLLGDGFRIVTLAGGYQAGATAVSGVPAAPATTVTTNQGDERVRRAIWK
jgi:hypothetical protein